MVDINLISTAIKEALRDEVERVILFGSYAYGSPNKDSDIDLYIVTKDDYIPQNWREKRDLVRKISSKILNLREKYPIDIIVHTKKMYQKFIALNSSFSKEILQKGKVLL